MSVNAVRQITTHEFTEFQNGLADLLLDAVDSGASIGFLPPVLRNEANSYWASVEEAMRSGNRVLIIAFDASGIAGAVQLGLEMRANGNHRAEVMKLMVHRRSRGHGLGRELMKHAEMAALGLGRTLLVLDTRRGDPAEQLYSKLGYKSAGVIPRYAKSASGELHDTVFMYRELDSCTTL
jgi:ribosomal protein S18 acetylase RimI-like enzyme